MTLEEYWNRMREVDQVRWRAEELRVQATQMEQKILADAGISCVTREPGFPCWTHADLPGWCNAPHEVLRKLEEKK